MALFFVTVAGGAPKPPPTQPAGPYPTPIGTIGITSGFADNDGSTQNQTTGNYSPTVAAAVDPKATATQPTFDWNSLSTNNPTYTTGTTIPDPYGQASGTASGWQWIALADAQAVTTDTAFVGGTKQDNACAGVGGSKSPNKDDLKRAYIAFQSVPWTDGTNHTILNLAWVRIPQNTTSSSAHIGFEFNQSKNACGAGSDGLVQRTDGDMLLVYDFAGGNTPPNLNVSFWGHTANCQVGASNATASTLGCWEQFTNLTTAGFAEANVDDGLSHLCAADGTGCEPSEYHGSDRPAGTTYDLPGQTKDHLAPTADEILGNSEFGEAGVDLTAAGVFTAGSCEDFGNVFAVSRSSGDSNTAAMEDLVGPGKINLSNCTTSATTEPQSDGTGATAGSTWTDLTHNSTTDTYSGSFTTGTWMRDNATVSVTGTTTWRGNVAFSLCFNSTTTLTGCDPTGTNNPASTTISTIDSAVAVGLGGTSPPGATAMSSNKRITAAGSYCWAAVFTHTSPTGLPDTTATSTECFTAMGSPTGGSAPSLIPNDTVTVSSLATGGSASGSADQKMTVSLYGPTDTDCTATPLFTQTFTVTANQDYKTTNDGDPNNATLKGYTISPSGTPPSLSSTTYHWGVVYDGDTFNSGFSFCKTNTTFDESATVAITGK